MPTHRIINKTKNLSVYHNDRNQQVHEFWFDIVFKKQLASTLKKIAVIREYNTMNRDEIFRICEENDICIGTTEGHSRMEFEMPDNLFHLYDQGPADNDTPRRYYLPLYWYRTITHYGSVNKRIFSSTNKTNLMCFRTNNLDPWRKDLLIALDQRNCLDKMSWACGTKTDSISAQTPKYFTSEQRNCVNHELPSQEQTQSYLLLCLESITSEHHGMTEKTWQHLFHNSPSIWHGTTKIHQLKQFGFETEFKHMDLSYHEKQSADATADLVAQLLAEPDTIKDIWHDNLDITLHNQQTAGNLDNFYSIFNPIIEEIIT